MSNRPRWGILGTGGISRTTVGDLHATENAELLGVASRSQTSAQAFAAEHHVPRWYDGFEAMLADDDLDVVHICTPIGTHAELARRALAAGKHVLVEKAFTSTAAEARELHALARTNKRFLMEAMWMRFSPTMARVLEEIDHGAIGEVLTVQAGFGFAPPQEASHWRPELGGGALLDLGVYPLTLAHLLLGKPLSIEATGEMREDGLDLTASVLLRYEEGRFATALTTLRGLVGAGATIGGSGGLITIDAPFMSAASFSVLLPPFVSPRTVTVPTEGAGYVPMFRAASQAISDGLLEHPLRPLSDTISVLDVIDEVRAQLSRRAPATTGHHHSSPQVGSAGR